MSRFRTQFRLYTVALIAAAARRLQYARLYRIPQSAAAVLGPPVVRNRDTLAELIEQRPELLKRPDHESSSREARKWPTNG